MKRGNIQKRGISLIALIITIIVMIIIAVVVILSLNESNMIKRAKGARKSSDITTAKEIVALAKTEWSFERPEGYNTFKEYAEDKLAESGYDMETTYVDNNGKVLFDTAARFAKAGVEIGAEVQGYTLNNKTTYMTSGKENTAGLGNMETSAQPATLTRDSAIKWTYVGTDELGNALLAGSVTSTTPTIKLGGKGGYINGPAELDAACDTLYSTSKGTARSINTDDIIRMLEYTGETSAYYDEDNIYTPTKEAKSIGQIAKEIGYNMNGFASLVPETGKDIKTYMSDYFNINMLNDSKEYSYERAELVFSGIGNSKLIGSYFVSSSCASATFNNNNAVFLIRCVIGTSFGANVMFNSQNGSQLVELAIRPVIVLEPNVDVTYNGTVAMLK